MKQHHAHEGDHAPHSHAPDPIDTSTVIVGGGVPPEIPLQQQLAANFDPLVLDAQNNWWAREFVGSMVAIAQARGVPVEDFLAERCALMAMRQSKIEAELAVATTRLTALIAENHELHQKVDDCGCDDEKTDTLAPGTDVASVVLPEQAPEGLEGLDHTRNGDS